MMRSRNRATGGLTRGQAREHAFKDGSDLALIRKDARQIESTAKRMLDRDQRDLNSLHRRRNRIDSDASPKGRAIRNEILEAMAKAIHVSAYANLQDELREEGKDYEDPGFGGDWYDIAPKTTGQAYEVAEDILHRMVMDNRRSISELYAMAIATPGKRYRDRQSPENFGYGFGMQALGHGVSWFDDNPTFPIKVPHAEFYYYAGDNGHIYSSVDNTAVRFKG